MKHYRISIDVDIEARSYEHAARRASCLYSDLKRSWIVEVLPNGIQERVVIQQQVHIHNAGKRYDD